MSAAKALSAGVNSVYRLDIFGLEFEWVRHTAPTGFYVRGLDDAYSVFECGTPEKQWQACARVARIGLNEFAAACNCTDGKEGALCWHVAASWRTAAVINDWPERFAVRWRWLRQCAIEQGRRADAERWEKKLIESGGDVVAPSNNGAVVDAPQAMKIAA